MGNDAELCECLVEQQNDCDEHDSDNCVDSPLPHHLILLSIVQIVLTPL